MHCHEEFTVEQIHDTLRNDARQRASDQGYPVPRATDFIREAKVILHAEEDDDEELAKDLRAVHLGYSDLSDEEKNNVPSWETLPENAKGGYRAMARVARKATEIHTATVSWKHP